MYRLMPFRRHGEVVLPKFSAAVQLAGVFLAGMAKGSMLM